MTPAWRSTARTGLALALLLAAVGCGGGTEVARPLPPTTSAADGVPPTTPSDLIGTRSSPRWEPVVTLSGDGPAQTSPFTVADGAIQWRVRWRCESGSLRLTTTPPPRRSEPLADSACPGAGEGFAIHTGAISLGVEAMGPWEVMVEQQVDTPLDEPLPAGAATAPVVARGEFYEVENPGAGRASILELGDRRLVLRLQDFETVATPELFVWLSQSPNPRTSLEAVEADRVELGPLRATLGNQNYDIPADVALDQIRSVVIWCEPVGIVYIAAALGAG